MTRPIHLVGHIGRSLNILLAPCHFSAPAVTMSYTASKTRERFTLNTDKVTCKKCLAAVRKNKIDPVATLEPSHNCW